MKMCQKHWDMLRVEVVEQGMGEWIAQDGETAAAQLADALSRHEVTKVNYDPLMDCHMMVMNRAVGIAGVVVMTEEFGCPICFFNGRRNPDGSCPCTNPGCPGKAPGSVPDFETWIKGPDSCVLGAKEFMAKQGWL